MRRKVHLVGLSDSLIGDFSVAAVNVYLGKPSSVENVKKETRYELRYAK